MSLQNRTLGYLLLGSLRPHCGHKGFETRCARNQCPLSRLRRSVPFVSTAATYSLRPHDRQSGHVCFGLNAVIRCRAAHTSWMNVCSADKAALCKCSEVRYDTPVETVTAMRRCSTISPKRPFATGCEAEILTGRSPRSCSRSYMRDKIAARLSAWLWQHGNNVKYRNAVRQKN